MSLQDSPPPMLRRSAGLLMAAAGSWATWLGWQQARADGVVSNYALAAPGFVVLGLGLAAFKGYRQERLERGEDLSSLQGLALLTPRWKAVLAAALLAVGLNLAWLWAGPSSP